MKLINKTQRIYLILVVILLLAGSGLFMFAISSVLKENVDEALNSDLHTLINQSRKKNTIPSVSTPQLNITPLSSLQDITIHYSDTSIFNSVEQEPFPYRQITTQAMIGGQPYRLVLRRSKVESDDLFEAILIVELIFTVLLIAGLFILNKNILQRIWNPFYNTLQQIMRYKIGRREQIEWDKTEIDEFQTLNGVLKEMIVQVEKEYTSLKQFTENASHEIQTPLSVISGKVTGLLQDQSLNRQQSMQLYAIQQTAGKLSRLNKALLKLTKIENKQYAQKKEVNISVLVEKLLTDYETLAAAKNIKVHKKILLGIYVNMNAELAELMLRNLLSNAIKHNYPEGFIKITLNKDRLLISNSGQESQTDPKQNFERFQKSGNKNGSLGLGLSIVSSIVNISGFEITYRIEKNIHRIAVIFN
jgi:signal transduction histidine kinase